MGNDIKVCSGVARATGLALALLCATSSGADEVIASGESDRTYHDHYAENLIGELKTFYVRNLATTGSGENLELLIEGRADVGFAQADVFAARLKTDRARYGRLTVVGRLTDECVYLAHRAGGSIRDFAALRAPVDERKPRIAVGPEGGGMHGTWRFWTSLDPKLADVEVSNTGGALALNQLSLGAFDAVGWVTDPSNPEHVLMRAVQANDDLALLPIEVAALEHRLEDGTVIYERRSVETPGKATLRTICTSVMIFAGPDADPRFVEAVSRVLSLKRDEILELE